MRRKLAAILLTALAGLVTGALLAKWKEERAERAARQEEDARASAQARALRQSRERKAARETLLAEREALLEGRQVFDRVSWSDYLAHLARIAGPYPVYLQHLEVSDKRGARGGRVHQVRLHVVALAEKPESGEAFVRALGQVHGLRQDFVSVEAGEPQKFRATTPDRQERVAWLFRVTHASREVAPRPAGGVASPPAAELQREVARLRAEVDGLRRRLPLGEVEVNLFYMDLAARRHALGVGPVRIDNGHRPEVPRGYAAYPRGFHERPVTFSQLGALLSFIERWERFAWVSDLSIAPEDPTRPDARLKATFVMNTIFSTDRPAGAALPHAHRERPLPLPSPWPERIHDPFQPRW